MRTLCRVTLYYACYGIVIEDDRIVEAAPIARWAVGKSFEYFKNWVRGKGGRVDVLG